MTAPSKHVPEKDERADRLAAALRENREAAQGAGARQGGPPETVGFGAGQ